MHHILQRGLSFYAQQYVYFSYRLGFIPFETLSSCPCCYSNNFSKWKKYFDANGIELALAQCQSCHMVFQNPRMAEVFLKSYYERYYRQYFFLNKWKREHCAALFARGARRGKYFLYLLNRNNINIPGRTVCEIGCSYGGILQIFKENGCEVYGYDFDEKSLSFGQQNNINLKVGNIDTIGTREFGLIILSHMLEHIPNPLDFLSKVKTRLLGKSGGRLLIQVPNFTTQNDRCIQLGHLLYFTPQTLQALLHRAGYKRLAMEESSNDITAIFSLDEYEQSD